MTAHTSTAATVVDRRRLRRELGLPPSPEFRRLLVPYLGRPADASPPR
ncbi:hypothetical protein ACIQMZ_35870 [Streptomyces longwoodensis]